MGGIKVSPGDVDDTVEADVSCLLAARCAARSRRTRSSIVSGAEGLGMPGGGIRLRGDCEEEDDGEGGELLDEADELDGGFAFACGVLAVNRVASATLRGL